MSLSSNGLIVNVYLAVPSHSVAAMGFFCVYLTCWAMDVSDVILHVL